MKNLIMSSLIIACAIGIGSVSTAQADAVVAVSEDGYAAMGGAMWIMDRTYCKAYEADAMSSWSYIKFAVDTLVKPGGGAATGDDVVSAALKFHITGKQGAGHTAYLTSETGPLAINAYSDMYTANTVVDGTTVNTNINGGDPTPYYASVDITDIVKAWLDGTYVNYGIKIENPLADDKGFYWDSSWADANKPYLDVIGNAVPEPATMLLLGLGGLGAMLRRRRAVA